nr:MAG TPA: hypothetical protein [Bacteriophage sp.]
MFFSKNVKKDSRRQQTAQGLGRSVQRLGKSSQRLGRFFQAPHQWYMFAHINEQTNGKKNSDKR